MKKLNRRFFEQPTLKVAKELLGKYLVRIWRGKKIIGKIVETEAYIGPHDKASHAVGGKITKRNLAEYLPGGYVYIYLVYGMYWQFNISTRGEGKPECVLIRAVEPLTNNSQLTTYNLKQLANGPGKLCKYFRLDKSFYGEDLCKSPHQKFFGTGQAQRIWLAASNPLRRASPKRREEIKSGPRIGIDYAGPYWSKKPWRFWVSRSR